MRIVLSLILALLLLVPTAAHDWSGVAYRVQESLVRLSYPTDDGGAYVCSGFSIDEKAALYLTAYHCVAYNNGEGDPVKSFTVDDRPGHLVQYWKDADLAVVNGLTPKPALQYRNTPMLMGQEMAAIGYAYGLATTTLMTGNLASTYANWGKEGFWTTSAFPFIGGMSGGPIFDMNGRVAGMVQKTDDVTGLSRPLLTIIRLTGKYWKS